MKHIFRTLGFTALLSVTPVAGFAQQEPLMGVSITNVAVSGTGSLIWVEVTSGGSGYTSVPNVTVSGGGGSGAVVQAAILNGSVSGLRIVSSGSGYTSLPIVTIDPPPAPGSPATAEARDLGTIYVQPFQNESHGPVGAVMTMIAEAYGVFPQGGFTYNFFVNGQPLGSSVNKQPAGGGPGIISWAPPQPGSYLLTVSATGAGQTATSLAVRYFATGTAMVGPVDNTLVPSGSSVVLQATATPPPAGSTAFVQRMDFYVDGVLVGSDSTYPYSYIYKPDAAPSTHIVEARGFDNNGNQISPNGTALRRLHMVTPIGALPSVRIANPPGGSSIPAGTAVTFMADAAAPEGFIKNVDFYINGVLLSSSQRFPFTANWTPQVPGRYEFVAIAFDDKSNAIASSPVIVNATGAYPTAEIISPVASGINVVQGSTLPVTVRAAGPDGGVTSLKTIEFLVDGLVSDSLPKATSSSGGSGTSVPATPVLTEPFVFNWKSNVAVGLHKLAARVTDANNLRITSAEITVNVIPNQAPQVSLNAPTAATANTAVTLSANANDTDGSIDNVEFYANGTSIGRATSRPYQINWTPASAGTFELMARATDNGGASAQSEVQSITVDPSGVQGEAPAAAVSVYRGDYGSSAETGRFAFGVSRSNRGTLVAFSTSPAGKTYFWSDIPVNSDGTFSVRDANNAVVLSGQTSTTGIAGRFGDKTFIGPVTPATATATPMVLNGTLAGVAGSQVVGLVGGDSSLTLYVSAGSSREAGGDFLSSTGNYSFGTSGGSRATGFVSRSAGVISGALSGPVTGSFVLRLQPSRITNISTRALAGTADRTLVAGFVVAGSGSKPLLVRAVGPTLANFGVSAPVADPSVSVTTSSGALTLASNNDWGNSAGIASLSSQVGAFPLGVSSRDAAVQVSVPTGTFTAVVGGATVPGPALIEIYDADMNATVASRITNISTRGQVGGGEPLIAGFVVSGDQRKRLLIRAVGPTLSRFGVSGVLADPKIDVLAGSTTIASNNDWTETTVNAAVTSAASTVGAFPLNSGSKDAAIVLQLNPGAYTVQISGVGGSAGTVLVEIYDADL